MKFSYQFKTIPEKFAKKIYDLLVENFSQTYFVGGMVRDMLLHKKIADIDICTTATPQQVIALLQKNNFTVDDHDARFGIVRVLQGKHTIEIATLRKDLPSANRYPKVAWTTSLKIDSKRRDFTVNSLYFSPKNNTIIDFHKGLADLTRSTLRFIGDPATRIKQDPLRIVRAYRFMLRYNFKLEKQTARALTNYHHLIATLTTARIEKEINKLSAKQLQQKLRTIINKST